MHLQDFQRVPTCTCKDYQILLICVQINDKNSHSEQKSLGNIRMSLSVSINGMHYVQCTVVGIILALHVFNVMLDRLRKQRGCSSQGLVYSRQKRNETNLPSPATQCTAMQDPGFSLNFFFSNCNQPSTTSLGGAAPSSKAQSCRKSKQLTSHKHSFIQNLKIYLGHVNHYLFHNKQVNFKQN